MSLSEVKYNNWTVLFGFDFRSRNSVSSTTREQWCSYFTKSSMLVHTISSFWLEAVGLIIVLQKTRVTFFNNNNLAPLALSRLHNDSEVWQKCNHTFWSMQRLCMLAVLYLVTTTQRHCLKRHICIREAWRLRLLAWVLYSVCVCKCVFNKITVTVTVTVTVRKIVTHAVILANLIAHQHLSNTHSF